MRTEKPRYSCDLIRGLHDKTNSSLDFCISFAHAPVVFLFSTQTIEFQSLRKIRLHWRRVGLAPSVPTSRSRYRNDKRQNSVSLSFSRSKTFPLPPPCLFRRFVTWLMPCWQLSATGVKQLHATVSHFPLSSPGSKIKFRVMRIKAYSKIWIWSQETIKHPKPRELKFMQTHPSETQRLPQKPNPYGCFMLVAAQPSKREKCCGGMDGFCILEICLDCQCLAAPCCQQSERLGVLERCGVYLWRTDRNVVHVK